MSLLVATWLAIVGLALATLGYCGAKLWPKGKPAFEWVARAIVLAINGALIWLCFAGGVEGVAGSLRIFLGNAAGAAQNLVQRLLDF